MDVKLGLICDYANVAQDGKLNVMGIFSRVLAQNFPVTHPIMHLVLILVAGSGEKGRNKEIQIKLLDQDGAAILDISGQFTIPNQPGPSIEMQQVYALQMLQFPTPSSYAFHVLINGETKAVIPLSVEQQPATPPGRQS